MSIHSLILFVFSPECWHHLFELLLFSIVPFLLGWWFKSMFSGKSTADADLSGYKSENANLTMQISSLNSEVNGLKSKLSAATNVNIEADPKFKSLRSDYDGLMTRFNALTASAAAAEKASANFNIEADPKYKSLRSDYDGLMARFNALTASAAAAEKASATVNVEADPKFLSLRSDYDGLMTRFNALSANAVNAEKAAVDKALAAVNVENDPKYKTLRGDYDGLMTRYNTLTANAAAEKAAAEKAGAERALASINIESDPKYVTLHSQYTELTAKYNSLSASASAAASVKLFNCMDKTFRWDDLKIVEGIGPKIEAILHGEGIKTWKQLAETEVATLRAILEKAGERYKLADPKTWPEQARFAGQEDCSGLKTLQDNLRGGKEGAAPVRKARPAFDITAAENLLRKAESDTARLSKKYFGKKIRRNDHTIVEGIGEAIDKVLRNGGITTWLQLSQATPERIKEILDKAGPQFGMHNPGTWPEQARLAHENRMEELKNWQDELNGGK